MRRYLPMTLTAIAALITGFLVRATELDDAGKTVAVGLVALLVLYVAEYLLARRR